MSSPFGERDELDSILSVSRKKDPVRYGKILQLAGVTGLPVDVVDRNQEEVESQYKGFDIGAKKLREESPGTAKFLLDNPERVPAVTDKLDELNLLERIWGDVAVNAKKGLLRAQNAPEKTRDLLGMASPTDLTRIRRSDQRAQELEEKGSRYGLSNPVRSFSEGRYGDAVAGVPGAVVEQWTNFLDQAVSRYAGGAVGAASGLYVTKTPWGGAAGFIGGQQFGGFSSAYRMETPEIYQTMKGIKGLDENTARFISATAGLPIAAMESLALGSLLKKVPGVGRAVSVWSTDALAEVVKKQSVKSALKHFGVNTIEGMATEGGTEGIQEFISITAELAGYVLTGGGLEDITFEYEREGGSVKLTGKEAVWARMLTSAARGAQAGGGMNSVSSLMTTASDYASTSDSENRWDLGNKLVEIAQKSELRQRDPETYQAHVKSLMDSGEVEGAAYVDADKVREWFQSASDEDAQDLIDHVPSLMEQDEENRKSGAEFAIPMDQYLTYFAPSDVMGHVNQDVKYAPEDLTPRQVREKIDDLARGLTSLADELQGIDSEEDVSIAIKDHMLDELRKVYPEGPSNVMAAIEHARLVTRAAENGETLEELVAREGLPTIKDESGKPAGPLAPTLEQRLERQSMARTLNDLRKGVFRADAKLPIRPLLSLIRDAGGVDPESDIGGELRNMGIASHGRGSFPGIYRRNSAQALDQIDFTETESGRDLLSGNIELDEFGRAEPRSIIDAIDDELRGKPLRTESQRKAITEEQQSHESLLRALEAEGLSLEDSNEDIFAKLVPVDHGRDATNPPSVDTQTFNQNDGPAVVSSSDEEMSAATKRARGRGQVDYDSGRIRGSYDSESERVLVSSGLPDGAKRATVFHEQGHHAYINLISDSDREAFESWFNSLPNDSRIKNMYHAGEDNLVSDVDEFVADAYADFNIANGHLLIELDPAVGTGMEEVPVPVEVQDIWDAMEDKLGLWEKRKSRAPGGIVAFQTEGGSSGEDGQTIRGSIQIAPDLSSASIIWTNNSDLSTFLHENGHLWLEQLQADASREGGSDNVKRDLSIIRDAFGLAEGEQFQNIHHERFARMVEQWMMEGKAPSVELEGAFIRFSSWLTDIYKTLKNYYFAGVALSDEVRGVLDRMVATSDQIEEARAARGMDIETFSSADQAGMNERTWAAYQKALEASRVDQATWVQRRIIAAEKRKLSKEWKRLTEEVRDEVTAEIAKDPLWGARYWLQRGEHLSGIVPDSWPDQFGSVEKIDRSDLIRLWGKDILKELPRGRYGVWAKNGLPVDMVAELFGVDSADQLVRFLSDTKGLSVKDHIADLTETRMKDRYGDMESSEQLESAVVDSLSRRATVHALLMEERALARRSGGQATPEQMLREQARQTIGRTAYNQIRPDRFRRAALKASRQVSEAMGKDDVHEALLAKQRQIFSLMLESEARKGRDQGEQIQRYFDRLDKPNNATRKKMIKAGHTYWDQIERIFERFEFKRSRSQRELANRESLQSFLDAREDEDEDVQNVPKKLRDEAYKKSWRELSIDELQGLKDSVDTIVMMARRKYELMEGSSHRSLASVKDELVEAALNNIPAKARVTPTGEKKKGVAGELSRAAVVLGGIEASLLKIESVIDRLDGFKANGIWREMIWRPIADARDARFLRSQQITQKYQEMLTKLAAGREKEMSQTRIYNELKGTATDGEYSHWGLLMIALNLGNESNARKLLKGYGWNYAQVIAVLDKELTASDKVFLQEAWDLINSMWPEIEAQEMRLNGIKPPKIQARKFKIGGTELQGGYFPVVYDIEKDERIAKTKERSTLFDEMQNQFMRPITGHGWAESRVDVAHPILLEMSVMPSHLDNVILDLTHREALMQVDRLLQSQSVKDALVDTVGKKTYEQFRPWLQRIATDRYVDRSSLGDIDRLLRGFRTRATVVGLGFRATTTLMQLGGHSNGVGELKDRLGSSWKRYYLEGLKTTLGGMSREGMVRNRDLVFELSPFMADRLPAMDRDMRMIQKEAQLVGDIPGEKLVSGNRRVRAASMAVIAYTQLYGVDLAIWNAAYSGAIGELGMEPGSREAVDFADSVVSTSQGSGAPMDLSAIQAGSEAYKQMTMFFSYRNTMYQKYRNSYLRARDHGEYSQLGWTTLFYATLPYLFAQTVRWALGDDDALPEEPEEFMPWLAAGTVTEVAGSVPLVGDYGAMAASIAGYGRYFSSRTPLQRFGRDMEDLLNSKGKTETAFDVASVVTAWGLGAPIGEMRRIEKFLLED